MKVRQLGKGGLTVSAIGLGCMGMSQSYGPGDEAESIRTLHRALGPKGLARWSDKPRDLWIEGFPENHSYVRKLASKYLFICPLWAGNWGDFPASAPTPSQLANVCSGCLFITI